MIESSFDRLNAAMAEEERAIRKILETCMDALDACEDFFDKRSDAEYDAEGRVVPNQEMRLLDEVTTALNAAQSFMMKSEGN